VEDREFRRLDKRNAEIAAPSRATPYRDCLGGPDVSFARARPVQDGLE